MSCTSVLFSSIRHLSSFEFYRQMCPSLCDFHCSFLSLDFRTFCYFSFIHPSLAVFLVSLALRTLPGLAWGVGTSVASRMMDILFPALDSSSALNQRKLKS